MAGRDGCPRSHPVLSRSGDQRLGASDSKLPGGSEIR